MEFGDSFKTITLHSLKRIIYIYNVPSFKLQNAEYTKTYSNNNISNNDKGTYFEKLRWVTEVCVWKAKQAMGKATILGHTLIERIKMVKS